MSVQAEIENLLASTFSPQFLSVENESYQHNVPKGSESHFKAVIVSEQFAGKRLVARHQMVYKTLGDVVRSKIHALALHTYTPKEWAEREAAPESPLCHGGSKVKI